MQQITPFLWFNDQAEEAMKFYLSVFKNSKVIAVTRYGDVGPGPKGSVMTAAFQLNGQAFVALNGGPSFTFTPAISFVINCQSQEEIDYYWEKLSAGGRTDQCGWLQDKYGLSWQVVPTILTGLLEDSDPERTQRVMNAMMQMTKIEIAPLELAYQG